MTRIEQFDYCNTMKQISLFLDRLILSEMMGGRNDIIMLACQQNPVYSQDQRMPVVLSDVPQYLLSFWHACVGDFPHCICFRCDFVLLSIYHAAPPLE